MYRFLPRSVRDTEPMPHRPYFGATDPRECEVGEFDLWVEASVHTGGFVQLIVSEERIDYVPVSHFNLIVFKKVSLTPTEGSNVDGVAAGFTIAKLGPNPVGFFLQRRRFLAALGGFE